MQLRDYRASEFPTGPGVYRFFGAQGEILYIGKATNLRQRVRSYFDDDLIKTRGRWIVDMVAQAERVAYEEAPTVLDALVLEAAYIKECQPLYNSREKDDRSFTYIVVTNEDWPRVLSLRERTMAMEKKEESEYLAVFGPFPSDTAVRTLLKILRKIIPYRDKCTPLSGKPCFNRQLGLCPGVCDGGISRVSYRRHVEELMLVLGGKREELVARVERDMRTAAKALAFEEAEECKKLLFALTHINDVSLISDDTRAASQRVAGMRGKAFRIEGYDIAHLFGTHTVGVMTVISNGRIDKAQYRKFKIRERPGEINDLARLEEVLRRRFAHPEWQNPDIVVVDGGRTHVLRARKVIGELGVATTVVSVVKDEHHKARAIVGNRTLTESYRPSILLVNAEAHRFAITYHRSLRDRVVG